MAHGVHRQTFSRAAQGVTEGFVDRGSLNEGCLSCHDPVAGEARMGLREGTRDCRSCHDRHRNVGEGKCARCHMDPQYEGNWVVLQTREGEVREMHPRFLERGIFDRKLATLRPVASVDRFEHRSPGHAGEDCLLCHDPKAIDAAVRIGGKDAPAEPPSVPLPRVEDLSCAECHGRTRYHR
jgi:predicted CXXCH cytochrome family protein